MNNRDRVRRLTNQARHDAGLRPLQRSALLNKSAQAKARELSQTGRLAHGMWWKLIDKIAGRTWGAIGENIADGQDTPDVVVAAWLRSPDHRANMLAETDSAREYTHMGVGHVKDRQGRHWWCQHFGGKA